MPQSGFRLTGAHHRPGRDRSGEALEPLWRQDLHSNRSPSSRRVPAAITTAFGSAIPCSRAARFGCFADDACSCACPAADRSPTTTSPVAMPTRTWSRTGRRVEVAAPHRRARARPDRPLGIVLVRLRIAEIDEHPVAHVLGDKAAEALDVSATQR